MKRLIYLLFSTALLVSSCQSDRPKTATFPVTQTPTLSKLWETDTLMTTSESVIYDKFRDVLYVANINGVPPTAKDQDGFISILSLSGEVLNLKWVTELSAPKGMGIVDSSLFVTDVNQIVEINIPSGIVVKRYPIDQSLFLNDITTTSDGELYISDSRTNNIYHLNTNSGEVNLWVSDSTLEGPNGLLSQNGQLMVTSSGGNFYRFDTNSRNKVIMADSITSGDGIIALKNGYLTSVWHGEIHFIDSLGNSNLLLDTKGINKNTADIWYIESKKLLFVPTFFGNTVTAYQVQE